MHFLCTTSLIISYKNQPLLLALGGWLEEKNRPNWLRKLEGHHKQINGKLRITLRTII